MDKSRILLMLLEKQKMTFQEIVDSFSEGNKSNRNSCHDVLEELIQEGYIITEPKGLKRGQKKWHSLTRKGQEKAAHLACDNINQGLKSLKLLSSNLDPKKAKDRFSAELAAVDWDSIRRRDAEKRSNPPVLDGIINPEISKEIMKVWEENKKVEHPLFFPIDEAPVLKALSDICQSLHKIRCGIYTNNSDGKDYVTAITSNGVYLFPEKNLEGLNLDILTMFPLSKARNIPYRPSK
jgi:hypothetical protein